jgi:tetratricopeptide (TPR) repeat protein
VLAEQARLAVERARQLEPNNPLPYRASGAYYVSVVRDPARGAAEFEQGLRLAPDNVPLLVGLGLAEMNLGRWDGAASRLGRAALLDPRSVAVFIQLADVDGKLRRYPAADSAADRALVLAPTNPQAALIKALVELGQGRLDSARAIARPGAPQVDSVTLFTYFATYSDLYWVLSDEAQRQVLTLSPSDFDDDRATWAIVRAQLYDLRGDRNRSAIYADSARIAFEEQSRVAPKDAQIHVSLGLALAYLGRKTEAVREGRAGVALLPVSRDAYTAPYFQHQLARIYLLVGEPEQALDQLEALLRIPYYLSPGWLRIDPNFDSLRSNPRFKKLVEGTA